MDTCIVPLAIGAVIGGIACVMGYRQWLKRDPESLERWAKQIKAAGDAIERKADEL